MQRALALALGGLLLPAVAAAAPLDVSFQSPSQFTADGKAEGFQWAILLFAEGFPAEASYHADATTSLNATAIDFSFDVAHYAVGKGPLAGLPLRQTINAPIAETLAFERHGHGSLYVEAESIALVHSGTEGKLMALNAGKQMQSSLPEGYQRTLESQGAAGMAGSNQPTIGLLPRGDEKAFPFSLQAEGLRSLRWANAVSHCPASQPCPDGAGSWTTEAASPMGDKVGLDWIPHIELGVKGGSLEGGGQALAIAVGAGGRLPTEHLQGAIRLPLLTRTSECPDGCLRPDGQTLALEGSILLANLSYGSSSRLEGQLNGEFTGARLDEAHVDPLAIFGWVPAAAALAGGTTLAVLLARFLMGLFSRRATSQDALAHPGRRRVHAAILAHPGATARGLTESLGISTGSLRNHLAVLEGAGLIAVYRHGRSVRYFENHGRYAATWRSKAVLRDEELRSLMAHLRSHPLSTQSEVVWHAHAAWGWTRSATQRRLDRLKGWGLLAVEEQGRSRRYRFLPDEGQST